MRAGRYALRVPMLLWHALVHLPPVMLGLMLPGDLRDRGGAGWHARLVRLWQGGLMRVFGMRMRRVGEPLPGATLFVANHVSWMDISALHSQPLIQISCHIVGSCTNQFDTLVISLLVRIGTHESWQE